MNSDRTYIKGLEKVQGSVGNAWMCVGCLYIIVVMVWSVVAGWAWLIPITLIAGIAILALIQSVLGTEVCTDLQGLRIGNRFRKKFIPWEEVIAARTVTPPKDVPYIVIETTTGRISLPPDVIRMPHVQASIWQHLNRYGKAEQIQLSPDAYSFWIPIPDDIPEEMDWELSTSDASGSHASERYELRREYIRMIPIGASKAKETTVFWHEVATCGWDEEECESALVIQSHNERRTIWVPLEENDLESRRFLLAIIRRIRELEDVVPIELRQSLHTESR